jgi:hypothetical protein
MVTGQASKTAAFNTTLMQLVVQVGFSATINDVCKLYSHCIHVTFRLHVSFQKFWLYEWIIYQSCANIWDVFICETSAYKKANDNSARSKHITKKWFILYFFPIKWKKSYKS